MKLASRSVRARVVRRAIDLPGPCQALLQELAAQQEPAVLESSASHESFGRYTLMACCPLEVITLAQGSLRDQGGQTLAADDASIWRVLGEAFELVDLHADPPGAQGPDHATVQGAPCPYLPGWIGYIGYEIGRHIERLPGKARRDTALPDLRLAFYDALLAYDATQRRWSLVELLFDDPPLGSGRGARALLAAAQRAREVRAPGPLPEELAGAASLRAAQAQSNFSPDAYRHAVGRCIDYIAAGDIFQVNLSQRLALPLPREPMDVYRLLRRRNPAFYAAYLSFVAGGRRCAVLSSSPELFLRLRGRRVLTRPIKGTRPRTGSDADDQAAQADLWRSPKDNAELAMIVDLLRNDLGRACRFGSVRVSEPRCLETHPTVYHLVATVAGELREELGMADLLRAALPGGSITGAPKIRAMEIIDELEPCARGVYTGCIGIVGADGSGEWNIAIRTIVCDGDTAYVQVGGGIVADSSPQGEYLETLDKARALLEAIALAERA